MKYQIPLTLVLLLFTATLCSEPPYVEVDGQKLTESDLKEAMPEQYNKIRREYNSQILNSLEQLAHQKMIETEAEQQGKTPEEYMQSIGTGQMVSEPELRDLYQQVKASGQDGGRSFDQLRPMLANYLRDQKRQEAIQAKISELRKKYGYRKEDGLERLDVEIGDSMIRGNEDAPVTIIEFSDFECPYCIRAQETTAKVREHYGDKVRFVFKDFPLDFHKKAMVAHVAQRCVAEIQPDKYWKFFDTLFDKDRSKDILSEEGVLTAAAGLGIDTKELDQCLNDPEKEAAVQADIELGKSVGVQGTPAFIINGKFLSGAQPFEAFQEIIDAELEAN